MAAAEYLDANKGDQLVSFETWEKFMNFIISFFILSISLLAQAQTVEKVVGNEAIIVIQSTEQLSVGDKVYFLTENLDVSGQGEITKVSPVGNKAVAKVLAGIAKKGMSLEKASSKSPKAADNSEKPAPLREPLSEEDRRALQIGEISTTAYVVGGIIGTYPVGLGIGHAIQGRYLDKGWIFTVGELGSVALLVAGVGDCYSAALGGYTKCNSGLTWLGLMGYVGFRIWEIIDVWAAPPEINRRYREIKGRTGSQVSLSPLLTATHDGAVLGLKMTF